MLIWGDLELRVLDLSESGACVSLHDGLEDAAQQDVCIVFPDGNEVMTHATVIRTHSQRFAVTFSPCIPFAVILSEQRRILRQFRHMEK